MQDSGSQGCFLCAAQAVGRETEWQNQPLWHDQGSGLVVAGLGGFEPGYVLIAPAAHWRSMRSAALRQAPAFLEFVSASLGRIERHLGPLTFWEHGAPETPDQRGSACVEHAHLHVAPGSLPLPAPTDSAWFPTLDAALQVEPDAYEGYLLLGWSIGRVAVGADPMVSQYYRRHWARLMGRPDQWDYVLAERTSITLATMSLLAEPHGDK